MPTRKEKTPAPGKKIETPEIIFLALPIVALVVVLLVVSLNGNSANGKGATTPLATVQAVSAVTPTPVPASTAAKTTSAVTTAPATTSPTTPAVAITSVSATTAAVTTASISVVQTVKTGEPEGTGTRLTKTEGGIKFELLVSPGHIGDNTYSVLLSANGNQAVTDATLVQVSVKSAEMEMGVATLDLTPIGADHPGLYSGLDSKLQMLSMVGKFDLAVLVQRPGQSDVTADFQLDVANS